MVSPCSNILAALPCEVDQQVEHLDPACGGVSGQPEAVGLASAIRVIDREHFGMNLSWVDGRVSDEVRQGIEARRPGFDPSHVVGVGSSGLQERIEAFLDVGFSKFVIRPAAPPDDWPAAVESMVDVLALQT